MRSLGATAITLGLLAAAGAVAAAREARVPVPLESEEALYLTSGTAARRLTVGYATLAADLYWIRAVQYYGGVKLRLSAAAAAQSASASTGASPGSLLPGSPQPHALQSGAAQQVPAQAEAVLRPAAHSPADYALLYPLLDLTTTLDPQFNIAYRFGSIFLAEPYPGGAGRPDLAVTLLEKGLAARPDKWEYMQDIGFVQYWWRHDYQAAAQWFQRASDVPGAPWFLRSLAATTLAEGGDRRSSRTMWQAIRESSDVDWLRSDADRRLQQLDALDFIEHVQADVTRARQGGNVASTWTDLIRAGAVLGVPVDPTRTPLELDASGTVHLSQLSPLFPLPEEPKRAVPTPQP